MFCLTSLRRADMGWPSTASTDLLFYLRAGKSCKGCKRRPEIKREKSASQSPVHSDGDTPVQSYAVRVGEAAEVRARRWARPPAEQLGGGKKQLSRK